jgi:hypothetical protein
MLSPHRSGISPRLWRVSVLCASAIAATGTIPTAAGRQAPSSARPLQLSAEAVNMTTTTPGTTAVLEIVITRWASAAERQALIATGLQKGTDALLRALQKMPFHGHIAIPRWAGPDPHTARLGWDLHYAASSPLDDGGQRIAIATDRYIGFLEAHERPRTIDYPFTLIEIRLDKNGRGTGKLAAAAKIEFDKKTNQIVLENYAFEPVKLKRVKIESTRR